MCPLAPVHRSPHHSLLSLTQRPRHSHHLSLSLHSCFSNKKCFFCTHVSFTMENQIELRQGGRRQMIFLTLSPLQSLAPLGISVCEYCCMELLFLLDHYFPTKRIIGRHGSKLSGNNNSKQFPGAYEMPDTVLSFLHIVFQGILKTTLWTCYIIICIYKWGNWGTQRLSCPCRDLNPDSLASEPSVRANCTKVASVCAWVDTDKRTRVHARVSVLVLWVARGGPQDESVERAEGSRAWELNSALESRMARSSLIVSLPFTWTISPRTPVSVSHL